MANLRGQMMGRSQIGDDLSPFNPVTDVESVNLTGTQTKISTKLSEIDAHMKTRGSFHYSNAEKQVWDSDYEDLNLERRKKLFIKSGTQVLSSPQDAPLRIKRVKGRTIINKLGSGNVFTQWRGMKITEYGSKSTQSIPTTFPSPGTLKNMRIFTKTETETRVLLNDFVPYAGEYYICIVETKLRNSGTSNFYIDSTPSNGVYCDIKRITPKHGFGTEVDKFIPLVALFRVKNVIEPGTSSLIPTVIHQGAVGDIFDISTARVYQIDKETYDGFKPVSNLNEAVEVHMQFPHYKGLSTTFNPAIVRESDSNHPRSWITFQTSLLSHPVTGKDQDEIIYRDGRYYKLKKWEIIQLSSDNQGEIVANLPEYNMKILKVQNVLDIPSISKDSDDYGKLYAVNPYMQPMTVFDVSVYGNWKRPNLIRAHSGHIYMSVSNGDSGWGPDYIPTATEIKLFLNGIKLSSANTSAQLYNGEGFRSYLDYNTNGGLTRHIGDGAIPDLLTRNNPMPYEIMYKLETPVWEPVVTEGDLTLFEGSNDVKVRGSLMLREPLIIEKDGPDAYVNTDFQIAYEAGELLEVYKDGIPSKGNWTVYGGGFVNYAGLDIDENSLYEFTYFAQEANYNISRIGHTEIELEYLTSTHSITDQLITDISNTSSRLATLENQSKEIISHTFLYPTLYAGWTDYGERFDRVRYFKNINNRVYLEGLVEFDALKASINNNGAYVVFKLPPGYRPKQSVTFMVIAGVTSTLKYRITIEHSGIVYIWGSGVLSTGFLSFDGVNFLAEYSLLET